MIRGGGKGTSAFEMVLFPLPKTCGGSEQNMCHIKMFSFFLSHSLFRYCQFSCGLRRASEGVPPSDTVPLGVFVSGASPPTPPTQLKPQLTAKPQFDAWRNRGVFLRDRRFFKAKRARNQRSEPQIAEGRAKPHGNQNIQCTGRPRSYAG